jgi:uncharacterized membrane protein YphA (DoxX/SURF4 family)
MLEAVMLAADEGRWRFVSPVVMPMRATLLVVATLAFLRIVVGLHFFLEGLSHLRDPGWSSAGFRKAAVGPLADWFRRDLPQTGDWSGTLGAVDGRPTEEAARAWQESVVADWRNLLAERSRRVSMEAAVRDDAKAALDAAAKELDAYVAGLMDDLVDYRLQEARLAAMAGRPESRQIPFERDRVAKKRRELSASAAGWQADAAAIGEKLVAAWNAPLTTADRLLAAGAEGPAPLWKADRFVSWSLLTIGGCLVLGLLVSFNAMGGACFLASVIASQPFWVAGAQPTYDQWVELAALLVIAALPTGGWSGLDYFLRPHCPLSRWLAGGTTR